MERPLRRDSAPRGIGRIPMPTWKVWASEPGPNLRQFRQPDFVGLFFSMAAYPMLLATTAVPLVAISSFPSTSTSSSKRPSSLFSWPWWIFLRLGLSLFRKINFPGNVSNSIDHDIRIVNNCRVAKREKFFRIPRPKSVPACALSTGARIQKVVGLRAHLAAGAAAGSPGIGRFRYSE